MADVSTKDRAEQDKAAEAQVQANTEQRHKVNAETMDRQNKSNPTPTQEENDLAAAGKVVDEKQDDGSPQQGVPEDKTKHKHAEAKPGGGASYQTRAATPKT